MRNVWSGDRGFFGDGEPCSLKKPWLSGHVVVAVSGDRCGAERMWRTMMVMGVVFQIAWLETGFGSEMD